MDFRPRLKDLIQSLFYSLLHDEQVRASLRLVVVVGAILLVGIAGNAIAQRIPPPADHYYDRNLGCDYNAELAGGLQPQPITAPPGVALSAEWFINNTGTCPWDENVQFREFAPSEIQPITTTLTATNYPFPPGPPAVIQPSQTFAPVVPVTAPPIPGTHVSVWRLFSPDGHWFGPEFTYTVDVVIDVNAPTQSAPRVSVDWWFVIPAVMGCALGMWRAGQFVAKMYSLSSIGNGVKFALATTFGLSSSQWISVRHGELENESSADNEVARKIGGPGVLTVNSQTAVLTERGAYYSRVLGPEVHTLMPFERVRCIYDLRSQIFEGAEAGITRDGIPVRVTVNSTFRFMKRMPDEPPSSPQHPRFLSLLRHYIFRTPTAPVSEPPISPEALRMAFYEVHVNPPNIIKWMNTANNAVAGEMRDELTRRTFDQLFAPDEKERIPRLEIGSRMQTEGGKALAARGIELLDCGFSVFEVPPPVLDQRRETWKATWDKEATITRSGGEAEAYLQMQTARAEAQAEIIQTFIQAARSMNNQQLALDFAEAVAQLAERTLQRETLLSTEVSSRKDMERAIEQLRRVLTGRGPKSTSGKSTAGKKPSA